MKKQSDSFMKISAGQYAKTLFELTEGRTRAEIDGVVANFVRTISRNNQAKLVPAVIEKFSVLWNKKEGIVEAEVTSANGLKESEIKKIEIFIKERYQAKKVVLENKLNPEIKGGFVLKVGDEMIDGSIAKKLQSMKRVLEG